MQNSSRKQAQYYHMDPNSISFKLFLIYDIFMVFIIIFNLFCLAANFFLMSSIGAWFFEHIHLPQVLSFYKTYLHPWVITTEAWFIGFLITEFLSVGAFLLFINTINVGSSFHLFTGMKF